MLKTQGNSGTVSVGYWNRSPCWVVEDMGSLYDSNHRNRRKFCLPSYSDFKTIEYCIAPAFCI